METITFRYGEKTVDITVDHAKSVEYLYQKEIGEIEDIHGAFISAVTEDAIDSPPLNQLVGPEDLVTIVVSDVTRLWMRQDIICRELVAYLHGEMGVPYDNMAILIALGTHRGQTEEETRRVVSEEVYSHVKVYAHDCMAEDLVELGTTSWGTVVKVNPLAVGRKVILIGGTVHHLMSGYGGGRKSILPGISAKSTINQNHLMCLDPAEPHSSHLIGMGVLEGNPVNEDMLEAAAMVNPVFGINIVTNSQGKHCQLLCGHWEKAWLKSCQVVNDNCGIPIKKKADVVIVSCGGYPKDLNLYQGVKSLLNAAQALKDGGTMIFLAECRDGGGAPDFFGWIESVKKGTLDHDLRENFTIAGYIFYAGCEAMARANVRMLTEIDPDILKDMNIKACSDIDALMEGMDFTGKDVYIMEYGGFIVPYVEK